ncbi:2-dehydro-3-deoxygalactonokinase [Erwinia sp. CGal63]|uniref:2-dehydro-3-deoxygalactonokinase n=1 Tax=Erwinia sp. CGal63 TaxID=2919889 RepID=UPI00300B33C9
MFTITIDSGTTNTRVQIWRNGSFAAGRSRAVGLRDLAAAGHKILTSGVRAMLESALAEVPDCSLENCLIVASGMITADTGLCPIPHLATPVALDDLARAARSLAVPAISNQPIWFIPGVKNNVAGVTPDDLDQMDMMRGEEVETFGLLAQLDIRGPALIVLPGSHSKFIRVDERQRIVSSCTTLAGELLDALTHQTLLASSLTEGFAGRLDVDFLHKGAALCRHVGFSRSCFAVRLLDLFAGATHDQKASFLLGIVLQSDLHAIRRSRALRLEPELAVFISGQPLFSKGLATLLAADPWFTGSVTLTTESELKPLAGFGALTVMEKRR